MKEYNGSSEFRKLPVENLTPPQELTQLPAEYTLPEEYPKTASQPVQQKKRSHGKQLIAMCLAGFVTIQLLFSYFVPATNKNGNGIIGPGTTNPGYSDPGNQTPPQFDLGDFKIEALESTLDDSQLRLDIAEAAGYFRNFDYVRASVALYTALKNTFLDSPFPAGYLDRVGYKVDRCVAFDFDGSAVQGCYVYFWEDEIWYDSKSGEKESCRVMFATMVSFEETQEGTAYRVITVQDELDEYGLYDSSGEIDFTANYIDGTFDAQGYSKQCKKTTFLVTNTSGRKNLDDKYNVWYGRAFTGSVRGGAFLNGTLYEDDLIYNPATSDFERNTQRPERIVYFNALTDDGKLNLKDPFVIECIGNETPEVWAEFREGSAKYFAGSTYVTVKYELYQDSGDVTSIYEVDYSKPLLPLDMHIAFALHQIITENDGKESGTVEVEFDTLESRDDTSLMDGLAIAVETLETFDYVLASARFVDSVMDRNLNGFGPGILTNLCYQYKDGKVTRFDGKPFDKGAYIYLDVIAEEYENKAEEIEYFYHFEGTIILFDREKDADDLQILKIATTTEYLSGMYGNTPNFSAEYFSGKFDTDGNASDYCTITFNMQPGSQVDGRYNPMYASRTVAEKGINGLLCGKMTINLSVTYDASIPGFTATNDNLLYSYTFQVNEKGTLDIDNVDYMDARGLTDEEVIKLLGKFDSSDAKYMLKDDCIRVKTDLEKANNDFEFGYTALTYEYYKDSWYSLYVKLLR